MRFDDFAAALIDPARPAPGFLRGDRAGFDVYRNNVRSGLIGVLRDTFPAVCAAVGDEAFRVVASHFVRSGLPRALRLDDYGAGFPAFVRAFPGAQDWPYLADLATVDWLRLSAWRATDAPFFDLPSLTADDCLALAARRCALQPSAGWLRSEWPIATIWEMCVGRRAASEITDWRGEDVLVVRRADDSVDTQRLPHGAATLLDRLHAGEPLAEAVAAAQADGFDAAQTFSFLLTSGALSSCA